MKKGRFLGERESEVVASQYRHDTLYLLMRELAAEVEEVNGEAQHALSGEDLFYLVAGVTDAFLEMDDLHDEVARSEASGTWLQVKQRLRAESAMVDGELTTAATLVVLTARECLRRGDMWRYWDVGEALAAGTLSHDPEGGERLQMLLGALWQRDDVARRYAVRWRQYQESDAWLSDELEALRLGVRREAPVASDIDHKAEIVAALRDFFWDDAVRAERFLLAIYHKSDLEVTAEILRLKRTRDIDLARKGRKLYNLLSSGKYQLYRASYQNFAEQVKV